MLEASISNHSESEIEAHEIFAVSFPLSATCSYLKPKWIAKIANRQQKVSHLMQKVFHQEMDKSVNIDLQPISHPILERLQIQKMLSSPMFSEVILGSSTTTHDLPQDQEMIEIDSKKFATLQWLKDKGYSILADTLKSQTGYPWEEIEKIPYPILMEQLVDLYLLCYHKYPPLQSTKNSLIHQKFVNFSLYLAQVATSSKQDIHSLELIEDTKQVLGQLIYLINKDPKLAFQTINTVYFQQALANIKNAFNLEIQEICHRLQNHYVAHDETQIQSPDQALYTMIPMEIAKALLTDIGTINVGIINVLSDIFLSFEKYPINYEVNISYALKILKQSPKLRAEFKKIYQPSPKLSSNDVIRVSLGISPSCEINDLQTRLVALSTLLSHLRQGEEGSCFAVSLAIEILSAHLGFCFKDFRQLLNEGKLTRSIKGIQKDIPFIRRISDENLHKTIYFDTQGFIQSQKQGSLWQAPGLQAVCQALEINDCQEFILSVIQQLPPPNDKESYEIEIKTLIYKMCEHIQMQYPSQPTMLTTLYDKACFAFSAQTSHPLLRIWENAIASMAEAEEGSMIKTAVLESVLNALQFRLGQLRIPPSLLLQRFFLHIQKMLYEHIQLRYDPTVHQETRNDSYSKEGGFILYYQKQCIKNEKDFRQFLFNLLSEVQLILSHQSVSEEEKQEMIQVLNILNPYIHSQEFMNDLLARYHPYNKLMVSQLTKNSSFTYDELQFTPWITQTGNNSKAILKVYFESNQPISTEGFVVHSAKEALISIIEMCKRMPEEEKKLYLNNPNKLKPFCILGKHRFPFMAGHPSLVNAWKQDCPTKEWLEQHIIQPGKEIANTQIDIDTQERLTPCLEKDILFHFLPSDKQEACLNLMKQIPFNLTIKVYRQTILQILQEIYPLPIHLQEKIARQVDRMLCQSLNPCLKKKLEDLIIHFGDTNWVKGVQDIHFCFVINPGTGEIELWEAYADGTHLTPLDQKYWLLNQKWEWMTIPKELAPDDSTEIVED